MIDHSHAAVVEAVGEATGGHGADVVYDPVGGEAGERLAAAMADEGRFLLVGFASGAWPRIDPALVVSRNFSVMGVYTGAYDRAHAEAAYATMLPMVRAGSLASVVTGDVAFDELPVALEQLSNRRVRASSSIGP